jgi:hypothetical protein
MARSPTLSSHGTCLYRNRKDAGRTALAAAILLLGAIGCSGDASGRDSTQAAENKKTPNPPSGTVEMRQLHVAFLGSGSGGSGTLYFRGRTYRFSVGGLGIGGIGVSSVNAQGEVYNLKNVSQFPGTYAQGRYGFAVGQKSRGDLWLQNGNGVVMHLKAKRTGLMLSLGGDAVVISMKK